MRDFDFDAFAQFEEFSLKIFGAMNLACAD
jgi:hypothetical protein